MKAIGWIHSASRSAFDFDQDDVYRSVSYTGLDTVSGSDDSDDSDGSGRHSLDNNDESNHAEDSLDRSMLTPSRYNER